MPKQEPWFTLPEDDENALAVLVEQYGIARILAVLSRLQMPKDRTIKAQEDLRELLSGN